MGPQHQIGGHPSPQSGGVPTTNCPSGSPRADSPSVRCHVIGPAPVPPAPMRVDIHVSSPSLRHVQIPQPKSGSSDCAMGLATRCYQARSVPKVNTFWVRCGAVATANEYGPPPTGEKRSTPRWCSLAVATANEHGPPPAREKRSTSRWRSQRPMHTGIRRQTRSATSRWCSLAVATTNEYGPPPAAWARQRPDLGSMQRVARNDAAATIKKRLNRDE